ncbi:hypothetical protein [Paenibacillus kobensis]|uniref:hypothetical protein n=1 Tax=Paenibacillus kobensis TaxID=59841 RepID=UPI000FD6F12D|nr:hypothetical protein [Paenibacillus kobensis]
MPRLDIIGHKYGRLTVIAEIEKTGKERRFLCCCDCGNEIPALMGSLRSGNTQSCGCFKSDRSSETKTIDLTGKVFGTLEVIGRSEKKHDALILWACKCNCGCERTFDILGQVLRLGLKNSCTRKKPTRKKAKLTDQAKFMNKKEYQRQYYLSVTKAKRKAMKEGRS